MCFSLSSHLLCSKFLGSFFHLCQSDFSINYKALLYFSFHFRATFRCFENSTVLSNKIYYQTILQCIYQLFYFIFELAILLFELFYLLIQNLILIDNLDIVFVYLIIALNTFILQI